jgi:peptide-methionine (R)-S-oxide reductase
MATRRVLLAGGVIGVAVLAGWKEWIGTPRAAETFTVAHDDATWRKLLTRDQYAVLRQAATEMPYSSPLLHEERTGHFNCAGCRLDLFSSATKFDSQTGWPSFWAVLDGAVGTTRDVSFVFARTEVHCSRCGGHLGHVFADGPRPTGLRYCMNGVAMGFSPASA